MDKIKLTGLWKNTSKDGKTFLSGRVNPSISLFIMPNGFKKGDKEPDYYAYLKANEQQKEKVENTDENQNEYL